MKQALHLRGAGLLAIALSFGFGSCTAPTLRHAPWSQIGKGTATVGASTGWAFYAADMEAAGQTGVLAGDSGSDNVDLTPRYGGALKGGYFLSDNFALGAIVELRSFDPDPAMPLSAELVAEPFETVHWLATSRYFFDPMGTSLRWKPFVGLDFSYIDEVDFGSVTVNYPAPFPSEEVDIVAGSYTTFSPVVGVSYLWNDHATIDMGGFYEFTDKPGEVTLTFPNLGGATADVQVEPEGLIFFLGMTFYF